jgi:hypothetical protein
LWLYPSPFLWLQVDHIYGNIDRAIAVFPVIDDGTAGIENDVFQNGLKLGQNFPNPTNDQTVVEYSLETASSVTIELIDLNGRTVLLIDEGHKIPGNYSCIINTNGLKQGTYFYTLKTEQTSLTKKMVIN